MGALDPAKILVILVIALIVLGPERLPKVAREVGGIWRELTKVREQVVSEIRDAIPADLPRREDFPRIPTPTPGAVTGFVSGLMSPNRPVVPREVVTGETEDVFENAHQHTDDIATVSPRWPGQPANRTLIVVHPELGDFAFVPDDPNMN